MADINSTEDLRQGFEQAKDEAQKLLDINEALLKTIEDTAKVLKRQISFDIGDAESLAKFNKLVEDSNQLVEEREKIDKKRRTTKKKLKDLTDEELKQREREKKAQKERIAGIREEIKAEGRAVRSREALIAANKALRLEVDKLDIVTQAEEIDALNAKIEENTALINGAADADRKRTASIGKYADGIKEALENTDLFGKEAKQLGGILTSLTKLWEKQEDAIEDTGDAADETSSKLKKIGTALKATGIGLVVSALGALGTAFATSREGGLELRKTFAQIQAFVQVLVASLAKAGSGIFAFVTSLDSAFNKLMITVKLWSAETNKAFLEAKDLVGDYSEEIATVEKTIEDLTKQQDEANKGIEEGKDGLDRAGKAFDDFGNRVDGATEAILKQVEQEDALIDITRRLTIQIAELGAEEELQKAREGENAAALVDRIKAIEAAVEANEKRTATEVKLRQEQKAAIDAEIEAARAASGLGEAYLLSADQSERLTDATTELIEAQKEQAVSAIDNRALLTQLALDVLERDLDILVDGFDNQKTINERRLANDRTTLAEKKQILNELEEAQKQFIENSNEAFNKRLTDLGFSQDQIDLVKENVDLQELVLTLRTKGEKALQEQIRALKTNEILEGRILEFVREINTFNQDTLETKQSIKDETEEIARLELEIADQQRRLAGVDAEESKKQLIEDQIKLVEELISKEEEGSKRSLELNKEVNDLKLQQQEERLKKEEANNKKSAEQQKQLAREVQKVVEDGIDNLFTKRQNELDAELDQNLRNQDRIQSAIDSGSKESQQSLAEEERRQQQLDQERKELELSRLRTEAAISLLNVFAQTGDIGSTIGALSTIQQAVGNLTGFFHGTDNTGTDGKLRDEYGTITGYTHENEMVLNSNQVDDLQRQGITTRTELFNALEMKDKKVVFDTVENKVITPDQIEKALVKAFKSMPILQRGMSDDPRYIEEVVKTGNVTTTLRKKAKDAWDSNQQ